MPQRVWIWLLVIVGLASCERRTPSSLDANQPAASSPQPRAAFGPQYVRHGGSEWTLFDLDLKSVELSLLGQTPGEPRTFEALTSFLGPDKHDFIMATNAGIFDPNHRPLGLHVQNGTELVPISTANGEGNFYLKPNGVFWIDELGAHVTTTETYAPRGRVTLATQSGPSLLDAGRIHPAFQENSTSLRIRSAVGVDERGHVFLVLSRDRVSFYATATLFRDVLHCANALYLDGEISAMVAPGIEGIEAIEAIKARERHEYAALIVAKKR